MAMELTHITPASNRRSLRDTPLHVSPLEGLEDLLTSETLTRDKHLKLCRANVLSTHSIDKDKASAAVNVIYMRAGLAAPLIIWTQSPLESLFAKICVDVFSKKDRGTPWHCWLEDNNSYDNTLFVWEPFKAFLKAAGRWVADLQGEVLCIPSMSMKELKQLAGKKCTAIFFIEDRSLIFWKDRVR